MTKYIYYYYSFRHHCW